MFCAGIGLFRQIEKHNTKQLQICLARTPAGHESILKGKRKKNEPLLECAYRETKEEGGFSKEMIKLFDTNAVFFIENSITYYVGIFIGNENFIPRAEDPEELVYVGWYDIDEVINFDD